ncbi:uncharacterized protein PGTG_11387 [Puccinia graminis f. sp. tritici CRL 75-36-700-3]|uniref:Uncharacterized protein n=1 Tax=Puccinia graminis f. sp. tritici (strain CRL 75-36-700-3 / race SCCL) TaxID=418459 RepID=E3KM70_PUCGT|nr:uncharacterized protein PGTG_11387 [Puccinia graminis f. sp. tritici CRL 75-36-700-3]EFP85218.1 hypothetical protein PGTG_11387 [Puccinia graminis f. sp. tritici CRL 75-36-700-3]
MAQGREESLSALEICTVSSVGGIPPTLRQSSHRREEALPASLSSGGITSFNKKGLLNLMSTLQVIKNWKSQVLLIDQFLNIDLLEQIDLLLNNRKQVLGKADVDHKGSDNELEAFSKKEILDRIDDDRERVESPAPQAASRANLGPPDPLDCDSVAEADAECASSGDDLHLPSLGDAPSHLVVVGRHRRRSTVGPHIKSDLTISLECDQLIQANLEDTGPDGLEDLNRIAIIHMYVAPTRSHLLARIDDRIGVWRLELSKKCKFCGDGLLYPLLGGIPPDERVYNPSRWEESLPTRGCTTHLVGRSPSRREGLQPISLGGIPPNEMGLRPAHREGFLPMSWTMGRQGSNEANPCRTQAWVLQGSSRPSAKV